MGLANSPRFCKLQSRTLKQSGDPSSTRGRCKKSKIWIFIAYCTFNSKNQPWSFGINKIKIKIQLWKHNIDTVIVLQCILKIVLFVIKDRNWKQLSFCILINKDKILKMISWFCVLWLLLWYERTDWWIDMYQEWWTSRETQMGGTKEWTNKYTHTIFNADSNF